MTPPQDPGNPGEYPPPGYGQQPPYGGSPQQPYGGPPQYGAPPGGPQSPYGPPPTTWSGAAPPLANYGQRVGSALIDYWVVYAIANAVSRASWVLGLVLDLVALGWAIYNSYQAGATGQSIGKKVLGIRLIDERTGATIGGGLGIGRYFLHILDTLACLLGWLWPLWDAKRQTFADKLVNTVVVQA